MDTIDYFYKVHSHTEVPTQLIGVSSLILHNVEFYCEVTKAKSCNGSVVLSTYQSNIHDVAMEEFERLGRYPTKDVKLVGVKAPERPFLDYLTKFDGLRNKEEGGTHTLDDLPGGSKVRFTSSVLLVAPNMVYHTDGREGASDEEEVYSTLEASCSGVVLYGESAGCRVV